MNKKERETNETYLKSCYHTLCVCVRVCVYRCVAQNDKTFGGSVAKILRHFLPFSGATA